MKQNPLPYHYQAPELAWKSLRRATATDFEKSPSTAISEEAFSNIFNSLMKWPADFAKGHWTRSLTFDEAINRWLGIAEDLHRQGIRKLVLLNAHGGNSPILTLVATEARAELEAEQALTKLSEQREKIANL